MKKILIILSLCYSFSFGLTSVVQLPDTPSVWTTNTGSPCIVFGSSTGDTSYLNNTTWSIDWPSMRLYKKYSPIYNASYITCPNTCVGDEVYNEITHSCSLPPAVDCGLQQIPNEENTGCVADPSLKGNCEDGFIDTGTGCTCPNQNPPKFNGTNFYCSVQLPLGEGESNTTNTGDLNPLDIDIATSLCDYPLVKDFYGKCVSQDEPYFNVFSEPQDYTTSLPLNDINSTPSATTDLALTNTNTLLTAMTNDLKSISESNLKTFDSVESSNVLIGQMTGDFKEYFEWQKNTNGSYAKALTDFGRDFLEGNNAANTDRIVAAVGEIGTTDTSGIEAKLTELIGSDTSDSSAETLSSLSGIASSLTDFNVSTSFDSNFSKSFTEEELDGFVSSAYSGFDTRVISALTTVFDSIDYGVIDLFSVSEYSFQDYNIPPLDIPMTNKKLEGKLMSADFLNALDFSMGRLAFLLATLLGCVYYVINRLFS